jgi:hypothetical protein
MGVVAAVAADLAKVRWPYLSTARMWIGNADMRPPLVERIESHQTFIAPELLP